MVGSALLRRLAREPVDVITEDRDRLDLVRQSEVEAWMERDKPQVIVLCDVSDSVRNVSRFMLQFVYSLQDLYSRVRSFIFVSEIGDVLENALADGSSK